MSDSANPNVRLDVVPVDSVSERILDAAFVEGVYRLNRGVDLRGKFDWMDTNRGDGGGQLARRYSGEIDLTPMPFVQIQLAARLYDYELSSDMNEYVGTLFLPF